MGLEATIVAVSILVAVAALVGMSGPRLPTVWVTNPRLRSHPPSMQV
jgi:hypothetical protein